MAIGRISLTNLSAFQESVRHVRQIGDGLPTRSQVSANKAPIRPGGEADDDDAS